MRIGQALGLRRQDLHLVPDAASLGLPSPTGNSGPCRVPGGHIHVVRRRNPNGAWSKAQFDFTVPAPGILLALYDRYMLERDDCGEAADNDMLIVTLTGPTRGCAMSPRNLNKLLVQLAFAWGSDGDSQCWAGYGTAIRFTETVALEGLVASIGGIGDAYDNAAAETVMGLYKN